VGWGLSSAGFLNRTGYLVASAVALGLVVVFRGALPGPAAIGRALGRGRRRFRRPLPRAFLALFVLSSAGGLIYPPNSYDAMAYRITRVLHWLAAGRWHWIHTEFNRLNTRGCGFEWIEAPFLAVAQTDRWLFLYNVLCFALLPGLVFSSFRRFGVRPRVAAAWMWLVPLGYCFLLQAGSVGNDLMVGVTVLAGVDLALKARESRRAVDFWCSMVAFALASGIKANAAPMALLWVVITAPCWLGLAPVWKNGAGVYPRFAGGMDYGRAIAGTVVAGVIALASSFFPIAVANWKYGGEWTGSRVETVRFQTAHPIARPLGNAVWFLMENFMPPAAPFAGVWNERVAPRLVPPMLRAAWDDDFEPGARVFHLVELQVEENAGLGLSVSGLLAVSAAAAWVAARRSGLGRRITRGQWVVGACACAGVLAVFRVSNVESLARLITPCYAPMLMVALCAAGHEVVVRQRWWLRTALVAAALGVVLVVLSPARPLFPALAAARWIRAAGLPESLVRRVERVYSVYAGRAEALAPAVALLPPGERVVGLVTYDEPESSLWKPLGSRCIVHVCLKDTPATLRAAGVRYVWVSGERLAHFSRVPLAAWLGRFHGRVLQTINLSLRAEQGAVPLYLVKLDDADEPAAKTA